ncbi:MAG: alpha/beta fold hydrolase [Flavobacteriales bacterium]|nr:alpha/beta fold hydrolase [Flavobacteriales bacterium]
MKLQSYVSGSGSPLIILHGLFGFSDNWQTVARLLSDRFEVHLLDLRNHGRSPHADEFNYQVMADDVLAYMHAQDLESVALVGHSLGGKVAMTLATNHALAIDKLVVVDIAPRYYAPHHQKVIQALTAVQPETCANRQEAEQRMQPYLSEPSVRQFLLKNLYRDDEKKLAWRMNLDGIVEQIENVGEALDDAAFYQGPVLFIRGEHSDYISEDDEAQIIHHFPSASIVTIPESGHWVHADAPEKFLTALTDFLVT